MINLDRIDQSIIQALSADGRMASRARGAGVFIKSPCHARLKRLEAGVIRGYHADIGWEKLGHSRGFCSSDTQRY